ncbi:sodium:solute symporter family protein [Glycomyces sp. L485]|uniref:sodium:solute symporter family protein n=1 Tax=Glycomyces sp. L485 TaxID=2909235 RepID=UPI001F4B4C9E|nr:sodium:solute symporter family protein [Glycomyces sp. L485]MCH7229871.1 sodium:solute symporter family protein [Glycomyces sp. L485]
MILLGVGLSILIVLAIGLAVSRKVEGDSGRYLVAGRTLGLPLVAAGLMAQAVDSNATLGNTDLAYGFGFWAGASLPIGLALCLVLTGIFFAKPMNAAKLLTLPDWYARRYGRQVEVSSSVLMVVAYVVLLAGNLVAGGFLFEHFLGIDYSIGVLLIVAVVLTYTVAGGMFADAYTAAAQMAITVVATAALFAWVALTHGISVPEGMGAFDFEQLTSTAGGAPINWATLIALGVGDIVAIDFMQRIFAAKSPQVARRACFLGAAGTLLIGIPFTYVALSAVDIVGADGGEAVLFTLLEDHAPTGLAMAVLAAIVAASCSTANGAILGTGAVVARNIAGIRDTDNGRLPGLKIFGAGKDPLLRASRWAMFPIVILSVVMAVRVPQTGILLTLAFDLMLAGLAVPFIVGHYWRRGGAVAALAAIAVGTGVRLVLFAVTPTIYGAPNDLLYFANDVVTPAFDGWPTFIAVASGLAAYAVAALVRPARAALTAPASVPIQAQPEKVPVGAED